MSPEILFPMQLVLGYAAWLLCLGVYVLPRLMSMDRIAAHRAIATVHSFRFFGLVFILPGVVGPNLPADFAGFAAYWDLATGVLAMLALLTVRIRPVFWLFVVWLQSRGDGRPDPRLLPRHSSRPSCAGGAVGRHIRDPGRLRARTNDHACRRVLFAAASSTQGSSDARRRSRRVLDRILADGDDHDEAGSHRARREQEDRKRRRERLTASVRITRFRCHLSRRTTGSGGGDEVLAAVWHA
jgi:hypothetical protein